MARVVQENLDDISVMRTNKKISTAGKSRTRIKSRKRSRALTFDLMSLAETNPISRQSRPLYDVMASPEGKSKPALEGKSKPSLKESANPVFDLKSTDLNYICRKDIEFRFASKSSEESSFQFKSKRLTLKITFLEDLTIKLVAKDAESGDGAVLTIIFDSFDDIDDFYSEVEPKSNAHMKLLVSTNRKLLFDVPILPIDNS